MVGNQAWTMFVTHCKRSFPLGSGGSWGRSASAERNRNLEFSTEVKLYQPNCVLFRDVAVALKQGMVLLFIFNKPN